MLKWLFEVLIGWPWCWHRWGLHDESKLDKQDGSTGRRFYLRCERCGDFKKRDLI